MNEIAYMIDNLEKTPLFLSFLLDQIPEDRLKEQRQTGKWSIHEQVCHLAEAQEILRDRFIQFDKEINPFIISYEAPIDRPYDYYLKLSLKGKIKRFQLLRKEMLTMLRNFDESYWEKEGRHTVFSPYSSKLLLMHTLNVDHVHLFSIEQLGLAKEELKDGIITLP